MPIWSIISVLAVVVLFIIVLNLRVRLSVFYTKHQKNDQLTLKITIAGKKIYELDAPLIDLDLKTTSVSVTENQQNLGRKKTKKKRFTFNTVKKMIRESREWVRLFPAFKRGLYRFLKHATIHTFSLKTEFGTGDAALTAQMSGVIWGVVSYVIGWISTKVQWKAQQEVLVIPHFQAAGFKFSFSCIASFRVGHAMYTALYVLVSYRGRKKARKSNVSHAEAAG